MLRYRTDADRLRRPRELLRKKRSVKREIEILININGYCIETGSKRAYDRLLGRYFDQSISARNRLILEEQIEGITYFLEHADFQYLRSRYPELNGARALWIILRIPQNKQEVTIEYDGVEIASFLKPHSSQ